MNWEGPAFGLPRASEEWRACRSCLVAQGRPKASLITYYPDIFLDSSRGMDLHPSKNQFRNRCSWYTSEKKLVLNFRITPDSGWFLAFKADCFATFGKLLLSNNFPLGYLAFSKKTHSQQNKGTTKNIETQSWCRVWICVQQGGWPTWANMPWDRRRPCAMPPQWCHKSPVDVKQFYNMTAPNLGSSLSISSWIHMNVSQTTNISTDWLMIQVMW